MHYGSTWESLEDRARRYAASAAIRVAIYMLRISHQLYRAGVLDLIGAKHAVQWSDEVWRIGYGLMKRKRR
jgi:hypothetical protein